MKTIGKDFLIINELDSGATSKVYLVKSFKNEEIFAAKVYNESYECYINEIEILKRLSSFNCPNIIKLISYGEDYIIINGIPEKEKKQYILLDYLPNKDLYFYISNLKEKNESNIKTLFYKIVKAVEHCLRQCECIQGTSPKHDIGQAGMDSCGGRGQKIGQGNQEHWKAKQRT